MKKLKTILYIFSIMAFVLGMSNFAFGAILDKIAVDLNVTIAQTGYLSTTYTLGSALGGPLVMIVFAKMNRKHLILTMLSLGSLSLFGITLVNSFNQILIIRFISGVTLNSYGILAFASVLSLSTPERQGRSLAFLISGTSLSLVLGVPLTRVLSDTLSWQNIFVILSIMTALVAISFAYVLPKDKHHSERISLKDEFVYLKSKKVLSIYTFTIMMFIGYSALYTYATPFITERFTDYAKYMPIILLVIGVSTFIGNEIGGRLSDKIGYEKSMLIGAVAQLINVTLLVVFSFNVILSVIFLSLWVVSSWATGLQMNIGIVQTTHHEANFVLSLNGSGIQLGFTLGSMLAASIIPLMGLASITYITVLTSVLIVLLQLIVIKYIKN